MPRQIRSQPGTRHNQIVVSIPHSPFNDVRVEQPPRRDPGAAVLDAIHSELGIGEIGDLERMTAWLADSGQRLLQLLPIKETLPHDPSPYGALSAMAIDPQFISLERVEDFAAIGGEQRLEPHLRAALDRVRSLPAIDYRAVRELKQISLRRSFEHFVTTEWATDSQACRITERVRDGARLVARRLRAVSRAARAA